MRIICANFIIFIKNLSQYLFFIIMVKEVCYDLEYKNEG